MHLENFSVSVLTTLFILLNCCIIFHSMKLERSGKDKVSINRGMLTMTNYGAIKTFVHISMHRVNVSLGKITRNRARLMSAFQFFWILSYLNPTGFAVVSSLFLNYRFYIDFSLRGVIVKGVLQFLSPQFFFFLAIVLMMNLISFHWLQSIWLIWFLLYRSWWDFFFIT